MKAYDYGWRRLQGFSHRAANILSNWDTADLVALSVSCAVLLGSVLYIGVEMFWQGQQDTRRKLAAAEKIDRLERVVVTCLNKGNINVGGTAFSCHAESLEQKL